MKTYTREDLKKAYAQGARDYCESYKTITAFIKEDVEDFLINGLKEESKSEEIIPFSYSFLRRKLDWEQFCDLTGTSYYAKREGYEIKDSDIFNITESKAKEFNLI